MAPKTQPTGTIGICAQETARYTEFAVCLANLKHPGWTVKAYYGADVAFSRHRLATEFEGDYLFFLDDDHAFSPDLLERLLAHGKDIVGPLCLKKHAPFPAVACTEDGPVKLEGDPGLRPVKAIGTAGMLIHRRVFDAMDEPYFRTGGVWQDRLDEDMGFCLRAQQLGFQVWLDTETPLGHFAAAIVYPAFNGEQWGTGLVLSGGDAIVFQQQQQGVVANAVRQ